ncbi:MAG: sensor histidine kinase [Planctomycetota bacterium]
MQVDDYRPLRLYAGAHESAADRQTSPRAPVGLVAAPDSDAALGGELLKPDAELRDVLSAWHSATVRLEHTHAALREEVARLTRELEVKNRELGRKNRLADLGQMASHVAHEVRNSLVPVSLYLSLLRRRLSADAGSLSVLDKITASFTSLDATVNDLLQFTSEREPRVERFPLRPLVDELLASLVPQLAAQAVEAVNDVAAEHVAQADRHMLRRAVLNLLLNAVDALGDGGTITLTSAYHDGWLELEVADSGPGLPEETLARALEPFYTTKPSGTGLGLTIVARIAEVHGGSVSVANCPDGGAAITLSIPDRRYREAAA